MNEIDISIIIPAFNEASRIETTLQHLARYCKDKKNVYEIIVVDDGSTDTTVKVVQKYASRFKHFYIIQNEINRGKGYSVNVGMLSARGSHRLFMDADNSVDVSHLDEFLQWVEQGYDVVIGSINIGPRRVIEHNGAHRRVLGNLARKLIGIFAVPGIQDTQRGFKLFTKEATETIFSRQTILRFGFDIEVLVIAWLNGFKIKEVPVLWDNPSGSKVTMKSYVQTLVELLRIIRNRMLGRYTVSKKFVLGADQS